MKVLTSALLLLCMFAAPVLGQTYYVSGNDQTLWMLRSRKQQGKGDESTRVQVYDLLAKSASGKWTWVTRDDIGQVQTIAATKDALHVFFSMGEHRVYSLALREGNVGAAIEGNVLTACPDAGLVSKDAVAGQGLVVLTWQMMQSTSSAGTQPSSTTAPTSAPWLDLSGRSKGPESVTAPSEATYPSISSTSAGSQPTQPRPMQPVRLVVQQSVGDGWRILGTLDSLRFSTDVHAFAAVHAGLVHVMISDTANGHNRLLVLSDGQWREAPLAAKFQNVSLATSPVLGMFSIGGRLILLLQEDLAGDTPQRQIRLASANEAWGEYSWQALAEHGKPITWPTKGVLLPASLASQILLLSQPPSPGPQEPAAQPDLYAFDNEGRMLSFGKIEALERPSVSEFSQDVLQYFLWTVMGLIFVTLFFVRPAGPPKPFSLPEAVLPANLLQRVIAAFIDFMPFSFISWAIFRPPLPEDGMQTLIQEQYLSSEALYFWVCLLSLYVAYCIVMEYYFGATVGKMIFRLRVVGDEARKLTLREAALRNLVKIVELTWPIGLPLLLVLPILNRNRQRLGDMLARTAVVSADTLAKLPPVQDQPPPPEQGE